MSIPRQTSSSTAPSEQGTLPMLFAWRILCQLAWSYCQTITSSKNHTPCGHLTEMAIIALHITRQTTTLSTQIPSPMLEALLLSRGHCWMPMHPDLRWGENYVVFNENLRNMRDPPTFQNYLSPISLFPFYLLRPIKFFKIRYILLPSLLLIGWQGRCRNCGLARQVKNEEKSKSQTQCGSFSVSVISLFSTASRHCSTIVRII